MAKFPFKLSLIGLSLVGLAALTNLPACGGTGDDSGGNTCDRSDASIIDTNTCIVFLEGCETQNLPNNVNDPECHGENCPCDSGGHTD